MMVKWRLGGDLGTNSLGWAALELGEDDKPVRILAAGSRIFSDGRDPKSGASLAVDRRDARAMRRRRDRFKQRQQALLRHLTRDGLFPEDRDARKALEGLDPFALRARALDEKLSLHEIGRAFFHLNQRRGFKSNRKTDRASGDDAGKIAVGVDELQRRMAERGVRTFGEFLHHIRLTAPKPNEIPSVRTRLRPASGEGAKGEEYNFYPSRQHLDDEFDAIWEAQAPHHPDVLTDAVYNRLHEIVFHQRPLKAPKIGTCTLIAGDLRLPKAHPLFQHRRLYEELNALMIVRPGETAQRLTREERDKLFMRLKDRTKDRFETLRLKVLKLDPDARFNKESENRTDLKGDEVAALMGAKTRFANLWAHLSWEAQWEVIERLGQVESDEDDRLFREWLETTHGLSPEQAKAVAGAHLPQGFGRFGQEATERLIAALRDGTQADGRVIVYSEAVQAAGFAHHSDFRTGEVHDLLPYYGIALERHIMPGTGDPSDPEEMRIGRLTNPTVHIGLNQLRRVVNALIRTYGPPAEIAIELARELKLTDDEKKDRNKRNNENRLRAESHGEKLGHLGQSNKGANRALLKLWEELDGNAIGRQCIYTGQVISPTMLFDGRAEVDHILPFAATLDDSNANKIVCIREANREKRKRSPHDAWGDTPQWEDIAARAARLPANKRWRFEPDAMARVEAKGGFLARHLVDTQYLSRLAREYLTSLYPDRGEGSGKIWVSPGRLTEMVRRKLGLNDLLPDHNYVGVDQPKNRLDHRHHAIDAAVIAIVDRGMLQKIARESGLEGTEGRERIHIPAPWEEFRDDLRRTVNAITVSHRTDHGTASKAGLPKGKDATAGRLHNDTAYGLTGETDARGNSIVVHRVAIDTMKKPADLEAIRDPQLKAELYRFTEGLEGKAFEQAVRDFGRLGPLPFRNIRRIRVTEPLTVIPIRDQNGRIYKGYKGDSNYRYDVWEMPDGKWKAEVISMFDAHQSAQSTRPHPAAKKVLSVCQGDAIMIERHEGQREVMIVTQFWQNGQVRLVAPNEAGKLEERHKSPDDPYKNFSPTSGGLKKVKARKVGIDELGRVRDPGFPARTAVRRTRPRPHSQS